jgi:hypothetical protein
VDNNPARVEASRYFREKSIPVIFTAVSLDGDHGYVFVQGKEGQEAEHSSSSVTA